MIPHQRFEYTASIRIELVTGDIEVREIEGHIRASDPDDAVSCVATVILESVDDWGCDEVDAPIEAATILSIRWKDEAVAAAADGVRYH